MSNPIPEKVVNFNVYDNTEKLVGVTGEVTLPNLEAMSETISGAGILGEFDSVNIGHFSSLSIEIPFRTLFQKSFSLLANSNKTIVLRAAQQSYNISKGQVEHRPLKISVKGTPKGLNLGKLGVGAATETTNIMEILYLKVEENGKVLLELDKLNFVYKVDGQDLLTNIKKMI